MSLLNLTCFESHNYFKCFMIFYLYWNFKPKFIQIYFNCDSNWYPVCPTFFFSRIETCKKVRFHFIPVVVVVVTFNCDTCYLHAWKLMVFLRSFLGRIYFRQLWKLHFWKLHEKSVLLVKKFFISRLFFFHCFFLKCYF